MWIKFENIWKGILTSTIGAGLMGLAVYGWYFQEPVSERLTNTEASILFCLGFVLLGLRGSLEDALKKLLIELPSRLLRKFFGNDNTPPAAIFILLMLASLSSYSQNNKPINVSEARFINKNDSTLISGVGQQRWDEANNKFRFGDGSLWHSYVRTVGSTIFEGDVSINTDGSAIDLITDSSYPRYAISLNSSLVSLVYKTGLFATGNFFKVTSSETQMRYDDGTDASYITMDASNGIQVISNKGIQMTSTSGDVSLGGAQASLTGSASTTITGTNSVTVSSSGGNIQLDGNSVAIPSSITVGGSDEGNSGQVLTSNGAGSPVSWEDNASIDIQHKRVTTGSINAAATAEIVVTWDTPFADTNYTVNASVLVANPGNAVPFLEIVHLDDKLAASITVRVVNSSGGALTGEIQAIAIHD